ncbi:streptomycin biosynthesis protein [Kibdelosporangium persicum]|uniref:Streptomycin biosynthesis operon regulator n=1 Tax=Kibdelosporangium persicum TaxID=2698649 RepID=A0ABX2FDT7_9PSEU|nr:streptomycin biosynthesis protein [Kibdelosporangium persicum]NRN69522.1 Streptomycin biosynthesis operon regulator [Kibdelosporangium persicum]
MLARDTAVAQRKLMRDVGLTAEKVDAELSGCRRSTMPVDTLLSADSPRINGEDAAHIQALAAVEERLPAIIVHRPTTRVIDGMHRLRAAALRGDTHIDVLLFEGSAEDAFVLAVRLNAAHGFPLSQADRNAAAKRIITSHPAWSDRAIAAVTGLSAKTVASLRRLMDSDDTSSGARMGRDGRVRPLNPAEARRHVGELFAERPDASLREVARKAGVSVGTARDVRQRLRAGSDPVPPRQRQAENKTKDGTTRHRNANRETVRIAPPWYALGLDQLKRDPSMRFNEAGRNILRLLEVGMLGTHQWQRYVDAVPAHCVGAVANAARRCAEAWADFAQQVVARDAESGTSAVRKPSEEENAS